MTKQKKSETRRMKRARLIRDGRPGVQKDFERAAEEAVWEPDKIRKIVKHRLAKAVVTGEPSNVAREAELLGKMKDVDMFVRPADAPMGIWAVLMEPGIDAILDEALAALPPEKDEKAVLNAAVAALPPLDTVPGEKDEKGDKP